MSRFGSKRFSTFQRVYCRTVLTELAPEHVAVQPSVAHFITEALEIETPGHVISIE
jgi:hypothetical protein